MKETSFIKLTEYYLSRSQLSKSIGTYEFERAKLNRFNDFLESIGVTDITDVTPEVINSYVFELKKTCISNTINKHLKLLRLFYRTIGYEFEYLQELKNLKEITKPIDIIDYKDLDTIIKYTLSLDSDIGKNLIYQVILLLLVDTGARISEVLLIEKNYIDLKKNTITLTHTKNKEQRKVFISDSLSKKYVELLLKQNNKTKYLIYDQISQKEANYNDVRYYLHFLRDKFNLPRLHAHLFRHTVATMWLENGADIYFVKETLGHRNISQTVRYLHANIKHRKSVYDKVAYKLK